ncbi:amino acid permease/ SLC12A domain-containing protein [Radiomyces spectabilis]|uniref:amino acid permease/ SLC12A domain-containing protein n=1 Tax=Radiomyces spectabilis TaxID=64574 RepID=UPI002220F028|nr:amino acid permease/ SLC12A domain-containing protein [Radiomyces spectabilis]KAI8379092.1 amino acid permease/ SLC12A domain-containing protein [Radiomyces spectabilis]
MDSIKVPVDPQSPITSIEHSETHYSSDSAVTATQGRGLQRGLKARHIQMIALGGTIGTGLFVASGKAISEGGPGGALVAYAIVGVLVFCVMMSLGEMSAYVPVSGSFSHFATRFADPSLGFMVGWIYWANWAIGVAVELTGVALIMEFWVQNIPSVVWSIICLVILLAINVFSVKGYGEIEYWFSMVKILTVIAFVIVGICVDTGAAGGHYIGGSNFHLPGGAFPNGFLGVFNVFVTAAFSFNGVEIVGIAAGESANPHKTVPSAVKQVFVRIVLFYILSILIIGLVIPYTNEDLLKASSSNIAVSPFTLVFRAAGAAWAADLMNAIILITMISAGNSGVYSSSRTLLALAEDGYAPRFFKRVNRWGIPIWSVLATCLVGCLAFLTSLFGSGVVFNWLTSITSLAGLITWISIAITHVRFRMGYKAQGRPMKNLPYKAPFFPLTDAFVIVIGAIVVCGQGYQTFYAPIDAKNVVASYICLIVAVALYVGHKIFRRPAFVKKCDMDFDTGTWKEPVFDTGVDDEKYNADGTLKPWWKRWGIKFINIIA